MNKSTQTGEFPRSTVRSGTQQCEASVYAKLSQLIPSLFDPLPVELPETSTQFSLVPDSTAELAAQPLVMVYETPEDTLDLYSFLHRGYLPQKQPTKISNIDQEIQEVLRLQPRKTSEPNRGRRSSSQERQVNRPLLPRPDCSPERTTSSRSPSRSATPPNIVESASKERQTKLFPKVLDASPFLRRGYRPSKPPAMISQVEPTVQEILRLLPH